MRWTLRTLLETAGCRADLRGDAEITGLSYDSRATEAGDLFCCFPGAVHDGHDHATAALEVGAAALLVERFLPVDLPQARVEKVRDVLGPLADAFYDHPSASMKIAAVTGTNGKTTVTYLLESVAAAAGLRPGVLGTVSRRFAGIDEPAPRNTPEATDLQRLLGRMRDAGVDVVAMEATSDGLEQGRLRATRVASAGFTNLTQDHLNTHGTMEAYFEAKALLFDPAYTPRAVVNIGDPHGRVLRERIGDTLEVLTYGTADADLACERAELSPTGTWARLRTPVGTFEAATELVGRYNVDNCLCAFGIALQLGIAPEHVVEGFARLGRVPGRLEAVDAGQPFLVLVDYAHTPDALEHALGAARELARGRLIVVFGCGGDRDRAKRPLMGEAAGRTADLSVLTSDNPRSEDPLRIIAEIEEGTRESGGSYVVEPDRRQAIARALAEAGAGDVVLIAGKGHESGQTFADRTVPFDDRDVARELLGGVSCPS